MLRPVEPSRLSEKPGGRAETRSETEQTDDPAIVTQAPLTSGAEARERMEDSVAVTGEGAVDESRDDDIEKIATYAQMLKAATARAEKAEQRLSELEEELDELQANAAIEGRQAGFEKGMADSAAEVESRLAALGSAAEEVGTRMDRLVFDAEDTIAEVVLASVVRIMGEVAVDPEQIARTVRKVAADLLKRDKLVIRLAPEDYDFLKASGLAVFADSEGRVAIVPDDRVKLGGCLVEASTGTLDARLDVQLHRFKDALLSARRQRQSELGQ